MKPCTKKPLTELLADMIIYRAGKQRLRLDRESNRNELDKYYCRQCNAYHTTSKKTVFKWRNRGK